MSISAVRRLLLIIILVLLVIDGAFLACIKFDVIPKKVIPVADIVAVSNSQKSAASVKQELKDMGVEVSVSSAKCDFFLPDGYRLVLRNADKEMLKPLLDTLNFKKVAASIEKDSQSDDYLLQLKVKFPNEKAAQKKADSISKSCSVGLKVEQNFKVKKKPGFKLVATDVQGEQIEQVQSVLESAKFQNIRVKDKDPITE